jgi:hypothetical protein
VVPGALALLLVLTPSEIINVETLLLFIVWPTQLSRFIKYEPNLASRLHMTRQGLSSSTLVAQNFPLTFAPPLTLSVTFAYPAPSA